MTSFTSLRRRLHEINDVNQLLKLPSGSPVCPKGSILEEHFLLLNRIGSPSVNGEVLRACYPLSCSRDGCKCVGTNGQKVILAVKKMPLRHADFPFIKVHSTRAALVTDTWVEIMAMKLGTYLVRGGVCPNLPMYFKYYICNACSFENEEIVAAYKTNRIPCLIVITEYAALGDLSHWLKTPRTELEWACMYFQVFVGLYAMRKYFDMTHHDLHWGNVLIHTMEKHPGTYLHYRIDGKDYYVPNIGCLFVLWDFGLARIPHKMEIADRQDYYRQPDQNPRDTVDYLRISSATRWTQTENKVAVPDGIGDRQNPLSFISLVRRYGKQGAPLSFVIPKVFGKTLTKVPTSRGSVIMSFSLDKDISSAVPAADRWLLKQHKSRSPPRH